jgi:hypothetical protein
MLKRQDDKQPKPHKERIAAKNPGRLELDTGLISRVTWW